MKMGRCIISIVWVRPECDMQYELYVVSCVASLIHCKGKTRSSFCAIFPLFSVSVQFFLLCVYVCVDLSDSKATALILPRWSFQNPGLPLVMNQCWGKWEALHTRAHTGTHACTHSCVLSKIWKTTRQPALQKTKHIRTLLYTNHAISWSLLKHPFSGWLSFFYAGLRFFSCFWLYPLFVPNKNIHVFPGVTEQQEPK